MACATLKRSLDWESLNQRPAKRRRCTPFKQSGYISPAQSSSSSSEERQSTNVRSTKNVIPSAFLDVDVSKLSPDKMAQNIHEEIKRLQKRKQLPFSAAAIERMQDSESSGSEMGLDSPRRPISPPNSAEQALFTFKQVKMICARMLKDREEELREKYDAVLNTKLAEQYDAFVKFTYDQIHRRYDAAPSYLS